MKGNFDNSLRLVRFIFRRERVISLIWLLSLFLFSVPFAPALGEMFGGVEARVNLVGMLETPAMIAMVGPAYGHNEEDIEKFMEHKAAYQATFSDYNKYLAEFAEQVEFDFLAAEPLEAAAFMIRFDMYLSELDENDPYTVHMEGFEAYLSEKGFELGFNTGALYANFMLLWILITVAIMNIFLVVRHTRADEERGRGEVIRSLPVGRLATLNATMISAVIINALLALSTGLGIASANVEGMGFEGSILYGVALGVVGLFFAALTAVFCQLSSSSRGASGFSILAVGVIFMLRAAGDMNNNIEFLSYISPMGLIQRSEIYVNNYWWPSLVVVLMSAAVAAAAYALNAIRDVDRGFIAVRPGRKTAPWYLKSSFGVSFRLLRNSTIWWFLGVFAIAASYGSILGSEDFNNFVATNEFYGQIIGSSPDYSTEELFVSMISFIMAFIAVVPVLLAALKFRGEEKDGRAEHILSRSVSRTKFLCGYITLAYISSVLMQFGTAIGVYSSSAAVLANNPDINVTLGFLMKANLVYLPAMWIMIGITVLLIGFFPKATGAIWGYYGFAFFLIFMGRLPDLMPEWLLVISPFTFVPELPVEEINFATLAIMSIIALALTIAGFIGYRRRDVLYH